MGSVRGLLNGSMKRLNKLVEQSGSRHMCYLVLFVVFVLMLVFFLTKTYEECCFFDCCFSAYVHDASKIITITIIIDISNNNTQRCGRRRGNTETARMKNDNDLPCIYIIIIFLARFPCIHLFTWNLVYLRVTAFRFCIIFFSHTASCEKNEKQRMRARAHFWHASGATASPRFPKCRSRARRPRKTRSSFRLASLSAPRKDEAQRKKKKKRQNRTPTPQRLRRHRRAHVVDRTSASARRTSHNTYALKYTRARARASRAAPQREPSLGLLMNVFQ